MAIYDKNGNVMSACYDKNGNPLNAAYDKNGEVIWTARPTTLRVANYNVGDWYTGTHTYVPEAKKAQYEALHETIFQNVDADVCCMQEAPPKFCTDDTLASGILDQFFDHYENCTAYDTSPIPYRTDATKTLTMEDFQMINFYGSARSGTTQTYEKFYVTIDGKRICFVESHYSLTHETAVLQNQQMMQAIKNEQYFVAMGDLNTRIYPTDADYLQTEDYIDLVKPWIDKGYNSANCSDFGVFYTYGSTSWESYQQGDGYICATDHIFTSPNITISNAWMDTTKRTDANADKIDHMPLVADLIIN